MSRKIKHESQPDMFAVLEHQEKTSHLPPAADWPGCVAFYRSLLVRYDAAMLAGDTAAAVAVSDEAGLLRDHLHTESVRGIDMRDRLVEATEAPSGEIPMWGQAGTFTVIAHSVPVCITIDGLQGVGHYTSLMPHFALGIVDKHRMFFSETGYRSCFSHLGEAPTGVTVDAAVLRYLDNYFKGEMKGKLVRYISREERKSIDDERRAKALADLPTLAEEVGEDDDEEAGDCESCGVDLAQLDDFRVGPCGRSYCAPCFDLHVQLCEECQDGLEDEDNAGIYEGLDDGGRTLMGNTPDDDEDESEDAA